jgi:hypothetical protein
MTLLELSPMYDPVGATFLILVSTTIISLESSPIPDLLGLISILFMQIQITLLELFPIYDPLGPTLVIFVSVTIISLDLSPIPDLLGLISILLMYHKTN